LIQTELVKCRQSVSNQSINRKMFIY